MRIRQFEVRLAAAALAGAVALASSADAADYSVTGLARDKRGTIELPLPETLLAPGPGMKIQDGTAMQAGAAVPNANAAGFFPPSKITLPKYLLSDKPTVVGGFLIPVPSVIQLTTLINHYAPTTTDTVSAFGRTGPPTFAYCPGATANPNCTTVTAAGSQGTLNGIIKYTAGPNQFGGTMKMLLDGKGLLVNKGGPLPPTVMTSMGGTKTALAFSAQNNPLGGTAFAGGGLTYGYMRTPIPAGPNPSPRTHPYGYMTTPKGLLTPGPSVGTGAPLGINQQTIFPLTTGQIYGYRKLAAQAGQGGPPTKHTTTGYDKRTAGGQGRILLVGSALSRNYASDGSDPPEGSVIDRVNYVLTFVAQPALPLSSPTMLLTLGLLVILTAGFAISRKPASRA